MTSRKPYKITRCAPDDIPGEERLRRHLELCQRIYLRMRAEGAWPDLGESDSPNPDDLVESDSDGKRI